MEVTGVLSKWHEIQFFGQTRIIGNVTNHLDAEENELWLTNEIVSYMKLDNKIYVETKSGSIYLLTEPAKVARTLEQVVAEMVYN